MAKTPDSAAAPYATPADYLARVDVRMTGDLVRDDGSTATPDELRTDPNLAAALADASGEVEALCRRSRKYHAGDLETLTGNGRALLVRIVCGLAVQFLRERRGLLEEAPYPLYTWAKERLQALSDGDEIFPFAETEGAGLPAVDPITAAELAERMPSLVSNMTRYFGTRRNRLRYPQ